jgi:hypothetical protein
MSVNYELASKKIIDLANEIIGQYHPRLKNERIAYVIKYGAWTKNGKDVLGNAHKCSEKEMLLTGYTFIITLAGVLLMLPENVIRAVIDHELSHCGVEKNEDGQTKRYIIAHDLEDFAQVIKRYGLYSEDVKYFIQQIKQISIFDDKMLLKVVK